MLYQKSLRIALGLLVMIGMISPTLAQACAVDKVSALLDTTKTHIEANETDQALASLAEAQALLASCAEAAPMATGEAMATSEAMSTDSGLISTDTLPADADPQGPLTFIAFNNTSIDSGPIDLYIDDATTPLVSDLAFGETTPLMTFVGGLHTITVRPAGSGETGEILTVLDKTFEGNTTWIISGVGRKENLSFLLEPVSVVRNNYNGQARVRVINLSPTATVDVSSSSGVSLGSGLGWIGIQDTMIDAGSQSIQLVSQGQNVGEPQTLDFAADTTYTLYVMGDAGSGTPLQIVPMVAPRETTRVQFVNNGANPVDIHYRPSDGRLIENLGSGQTSEWVSLESGAVTFITFAPGTGPGGKQLEGLSVQLVPGRDLTVTVTDTDMSVTNTAFSPAS